MGIFERIIVALCNTLRVNKFSIRQFYLTLIVAQKINFPVSGSQESEPPRP